jgi:hypothetical protein
MSLSGTRDARSNLRQRCRPARQSRPNAPFASCSLCGHNFATRTASSELDNPGSNISMPQILSFFSRKRQDDCGRYPSSCFDRRNDGLESYCFPTLSQKRDRMGHPFSCSSLVKSRSFPFTAFRVRMTAQRRVVEFSSKLLYNSVDFSSTSLRLFAMKSLSG